MRVESQPLTGLSGTASAGLLDRRGWGLSPALSFLAGICLFVPAYALGYRFGMIFSPAIASPFWFPDSVLLAALLLSPKRCWWIFVLASLPIRLFAEVSHGIPLWFLLVTFAIDSAKGLVTAALLTRFLKIPARLATVREFAIYTLFAVALVPATSAFAGAAARHALGYAYRPAWEQWFLGDALAHLVITPALLYWLFWRVWPLPLDLGSTRRRIEAAVLVIGLLVTSQLLLASQVSHGAADALTFLPAPFLFWAAVRFGMLGASGGVVVLTVYSVLSALHGIGPFSAGSPEQTARALQEFLLLRVPALYLVAILIHQMKAVEHELRESERRFRNLANTAPVMIWSTDPDRRLTFLNQVWLDYSGNEPDAPGPGAWTERVHPDDRPHTIEVEERSLARRERFRVECRLRRHDGAYRWMACAGVPCSDAKGEFVGYIGSCVDIHDKREAEQEMKRLWMDLAHASRVANLGELTGALAHELKQPLGAILSNAEAAEMLLAADPPQLGTVREILGDIREDDQRAAEMITRLRSLLRKQELVTRPLEVNPFVAEALRLAGMEAAERRARLTHEAGDGLPRVAGDRVHLQQVLMNLILNGLDAMRGTPESSRRLVVRTSPCDGGVLLSVADAGPGIDEAARKRLFEPFWSTKEGGLGLGLSISRSIVEAHQGRIWVENRPEGGAAFLVFLPAARESPT